MGDGEMGYWRGLLRSIVLIYGIMPAAVPIVKWGGDEDEMEPAPAPAGVGAI